MEVDNFLAEPFQTIWSLALSLALGLIIGLERGWHEREAGEGNRIAGMRTFGLIALLGGVSALVAEQTGPFFVPLGLAIIGILLGLGYWHTVIKTGHLGITTLIAGLITYSLGVLAISADEIIAVSVAVATAILLGLKPTLHTLLKRIEEHELHAALRLLLISFVVLPLLPDQGYGPYEAINPYKIWLMVVLISALSFAGYIAIKLLGPKKGIFAVAVFGGMVSSTAITLSFSNFARNSPEYARPLAAGVMLASSIMFLRIGVLVAVFASNLLLELALPLAITAMTGFLGAALLTRHFAVPETPKQMLANPLGLKMALLFGTIVAIASLLAHWFRDNFGDAGLYILAVIFGTADVDAYTLSVTNMIGGNLPVENLPLELAAKAIILAALTNTVSKTILALIISRKIMARYLFLMTLVMIVAAISGLLIMAVI